MEYDFKFRQVAVALFVCLGVQFGPATAGEPTVLTPWSAPSQQPAPAYKLEPVSYAPATQDVAEFEPVTIAAYPVDDMGWGTFIRRNYYDARLLERSADRCVYAGFLKLPSAMELMPQCRRTRLESPFSI